MASSGKAKDKNYTWRRYHRNTSVTSSYLTRGVDVLDDLIGAVCTDWLIRGNMWWKVLNIADLFCLHGNIRPGNTTILLFFGALHFFFTFSYFPLRSVGYIALYKLNFQNWQHWKCLIPRGPFNSRLILTARGLTLDVRIWRLKSILALKYL